MQVDVGAGVMMQAEAASISTLLVDIGLGFRVECDIAEARDVASLHVSTAQVSHTIACFLRLFLPPEHLQPWLSEFEIWSFTAAVEHMPRPSVCLCRQTWHGMLSKGVQCKPACSGNVEAAGQWIQECKHSLVTHPGPWDTAETLHVWYEGATFNKPLLFASKVRACQSCMIVHW